MKILFVCTGNTCRSPMAQYLFQRMCEKAGKSEIRIESAGVAPATWLSFPKEAQDALSEEGVQPMDHTPKGIDEDLLATSDLILVMEDQHKNFIAREFPFAKNKCHLLKVYTGVEDPLKNIPDPFGQPLAVYKNALADIKEALEKLLEKI